MRYGAMFTMMLGLIAFAYFSAQGKMSAQKLLPELQLSMGVEDLEAVVGSPFATDRNQSTYILDDSSHLTVTFRDEKVASAVVRFHRPLKIEDPKMRELSLVQMDSNTFTEENPSWFFAGKPEEGLIYKITSDGKVESITWVQPFTYGNNQPKHLQALLRDLHDQNVSNM